MLNMLLVIPYILIEDYLKSYNLKFVLIKKNIMFRCHLIRMSIWLTCQFKNRLKKMLVQIQLLEMNKSYEIT